MTAAQHRRPVSRRAGVLPRVALAVTTVVVAGAGVLTGLIVEVPASAATVVTPAVVPPHAPTRTTASPAAAPASAAPTTTRRPAPTAAPTRHRASSTPTTSKHRYTEDELRERARTLTNDDLRAGRGSMPDGGLTSGETQFTYGCEQGWIPAADCS